MCRVNYLYKLIIVSFFSFLLHVKVKDFPTCTAISNIWLRNPNNYKLPDYNTFVELYIAKLLVPLDRWAEIPQFLHNCPGLSDSDREYYTKHMQTLQRKKEQDEIDKIEEIDTENSEESEIINEETNGNKKSPKDFIKEINSTGSVPKGAFFFFFFTLSLHFLIHKISFFS